MKIKTTFYGLFVLCLSSCLCATKGYAQTDEQLPNLIARALRSQLPAETIYESYKPGFEKLTLNQLIPSVGNDTKVSELRQQAAETAKRYGEQQFGNDLAESISPHYHGTQQELQAYLQLAESPEMTVFLKKQNNAIDAVSNNWNSVLRALLQDIEQGKTPEAMEEAPCTESFKKQFNSYYKHKEIDQLLNTVCDELRAMAKDEKSEEQIEQFISFMKSYYRTMLCNSMIHYEVTEAELELWEQLFAQTVPLEAALELWNAEVTKDPMGFARFFNQKYNEWLSAQKQQ